MPASMEQKCLKQKCFQETFRGPSPTFLFLSTWANKPFICNGNSKGRLLALLGPQYHIKLRSTKAKPFAGFMDSKQQTFLKLFLGGILRKVKLIKACMS